MSGTSTDLSALDTRKFAEAGRAVQLRHPGSGELLKATVRVRGYDSDAYQRTLDAQQQRRLERLPTHRVTVDEMRQEALELAAALIAGWEHLAVDGQPLEYAESASVTLLKRFPWIREQVEVAAAERGKFLPASAPSSSPTPGTTAN